MSREWKPGDVAMVEWNDGRRTVAIVAEVSRPNYVNVWTRVADSDGPFAFRADALRPLIVIDLAPEMDDVGGGTVARWLRQAAEKDGRPGIISGFAHLARQIEEQSDPPKPAEPTGLGAVVEVHGKRWTYTGDRDAGGQWWYSASDPERWSAFDSVAVLSGGVTL